MLKMKYTNSFSVLISWVNVIFVALAQGVKVDHQTPNELQGDLNDFHPPPDPFALFDRYGSLHTMDKLSFWASWEEEIYSTLVTRRQEIKQEIALIIDFMTDFENSSGNAFAGAKKPVQTIRDRGRMIGSSPVLAYLMTERYANILGPLQKLLNSKGYLNTEQVYKNVLKTDELLSARKNDSNIWPNLVDFYVSNAAILRMHYAYYDYKSVDFSPGSTIDTAFGGILESTHAILLTAIAFLRGRYALSLEWLEFAQLRLSATEELENDDNVNFGRQYEMGLIKTLISIAIRTHNHQLRDIYERLNYNDLMLDLFPVPVEPSWPMQLPRLNGRGFIAKQHGEELGNDSHAYYNMLSLCNGKVLQPISVKSHLFCFLDKSSHPYFVLNPLKTEQLAKYPLILQFYEVLGNKSLEMILSRRGNLTLEPVSMVESENLSTILNRRSYAANLPTDTLLINKIREKTELVTGLKLDKNNEYSRRIAEYIYGRYFSVHRDVFFERGNRKLTQAIEGEPCATLMFNLEVPIVGGVNMFSSVGVSSYPVRGSAVFWTNMFQNGTFRNDVFHTGCPVRHGHKIILTEWIPYHTNFGKFMCTLNKLE